MARILVSTVPVAGHIAPFIPVVQGLRERGHDVWWYTGQKFQKKVEQAGAIPRCFSAAKDYDDADFDAAFPGRGELKGLTQLQFDMKRVFVEPAAGQLADLERLNRELKPDLVLADPGLLGSGLLREKGGAPFGVLGVLPLPVTSCDAAPFGLGLPPSSSFFGRLRNRFLNALVQGVLFRESQQAWNQVRQSVGLGTTKRWWMDGALERAAFYLHPSIPAFEYPRSDLPQNVHFVGAIEVAPPQITAAPDFLRELDGSKPVIHVTQGTLANTAPDLFMPAIEALANQDVLVVIATGGRPLESLNLGPLPSNVRVASFLDYRSFLPKVSLVISNGGFGGVQLALRLGIPLIVAGASEDKPEVAARVAWSGAGINLKTAKPNAEQIRRAVARLQNEPEFRANAQRLAREYAQYPGASRVVERVESYVGQKRAAA